MAKIAPTQPLLILLYGFPGSGKTYFARQLCERLQAAHLQADRIRGELFEKPRYDKQENDVISQLMNYMTGEFLSAGVSVVYDANAMRAGQRQLLRSIAHHAHALPLLIWFQTDPDSAYARSTRRDRRRADDKYAATFDRKTFDNLIAHMQNPATTEDYLVVSGKHTFPTQYSALMRKLRDASLIPADTATPLVKPGLVNLVPRANLQRGRVDISRRNISIR
ncbi:MAG TPA: ATP-binding protein [Candidatus Saccharimonadales bacterium]|nr:ATP-binding protein [Candidatus Saccharimonadales bacterium]